MKRLTPPFRILILTLVFFLTGGCYSFEPVRVYKTVDNQRPAWAVEDKTETRAAHKIRYGVYIKKYLVKISSPAPLAKINNRAVDYALAGKFIEAENLLLDALGEYPGSPALNNNLGVINEIFGRRSAASDYYLRAAAADPDCGRFRENYLSFDDFGGR